MGINEWVLRREGEKMNNVTFLGMTWLMNIIDLFHPHVGKRARTFGIEKGMTVIDYGCGPGRYTVEFAEIVGDEGKVIAADIHEMAIEAVKKKTMKKDIKNVETVLIDGYDSGLPDNVADMACALDMFFSVWKPTEFLKELNRITKKDGVLIIDDGHQKREITRRKILESGFWEIFEESKDHLRCRPLTKD